MDPVPVNELASTIQSFTGSAFVAMVTIAFLIIVRDWIGTLKRSRNKEKIEVPS